jgi:hypothetical protein
MRRSARASPQMNFALSRLLVSSSPRAWNLTALTASAEATSFKRFQIADFMDARRGDEARST